MRVPKDGDYVIAIREASNGPGRAVHFNLDRKPLSKPFAIPDTGGLSQWREISAPTVHLIAGQHTLALVTDAAGPSGTVGHIDYFAVRAK